ncbi:hypothetical protein DY000_02013797 [Brassica cretica]|uniref:Uncharacterized protein n=1 Tax=Brassica cretica TaxID=69181 RepID=A0ABQ7D9W6_BRACR|nr:hypothetical protein DY000_02013797 [Brassica cretica]
MLSRGSTRAATEPPSPGDNTEKRSSPHAPTTENQPHDLPVSGGTGRTKNRRERSLTKTPRAIELLVGTVGPRKLLAILRRSEQTGEKIDAGSSTFLSTASIPTDLQRFPTKRLRVPTSHENRLHRLALTRKRRRHICSIATETKPPGSTANGDETWGGENRTKASTKTAKRKRRADVTKKKRKRSSRRRSTEPPPLELKGRGGGARILLERS